MARRRVKSSAAGRRRSAMGEYLPAPGERPLSSYVLPTPSAFDYRPSTRATLPSGPSYTLTSRPTVLRRLPSPSPNNYITRGSPLKRGRFTLTRKGNTWPYSPQEDAHITCSPGAGHYRRVQGNTGSAQQRSLSARHREGVHPGHPNLLVPPVDTLGFETPGPNLWMDSERGPRHTFGITLKSADGDTVGPGPAAYSLLPTESPAPLIGEVLPIDQEPDYPAPNQYDVSDTFGTGPGKTFGTKQEVKQDAVSPAPNTYNSHGVRSGVTHTLSYRPFTMHVEPTPGSADYHVTSSDLPAPARYSCRKHCIPAFPEILLYPEHNTLNTPGPGNYENGWDFTDNFSPKHSIGLPLPLKPNANPGPNRYTVDHQPTQPTPPSFSMARGLSGPMPSGSLPGPSDYMYRPASATSVSITPRRHRTTGHEGPAANAYTVQRGQTSRGQFKGPAASMKGRMSSVAYSGFSSNHLARIASLST